jgi:ABC-2 type transport system permease protein
MLSPLILAIWMPLDTGRDWVEGFPSILLSAIIPIILVAITVPDSFAGERERHTLGTLLASRLPDRAILFGKLIVSVGFAWGLTLIVLLLGLVTVNIAHGDDGILFYSRTVLLADLALSFLMTTLCSGTGILISLRSATVQEATQTLTAIFLVPPMLLQFVFFAFHDQIREFLEGLSGEQVLLVFVIVLALIDLGVFVMAMARFQRSRLYLD